jgi:PhnB protein
VIETITPCIVMDGKAKEAVHFYENVLNAHVINLQTYGEMPMPCPDALKDRVSNALLRIGGSDLMLFDAPSQPSLNIDGTDHWKNGKAEVTINLSISNAETTRQIFNDLQKEGKVIAPLEAVPFSPAFGTVMDKFGVTFILIAQE